LKDYFSLKEVLRTTYCEFSTHVVADAHRTRATKRTVSNTCIEFPRVTRALQKFKKSIGSAHCSEAPQPDRGQRWLPRSHFLMCRVGTTVSRRASASRPSLGLVHLWVENTPADYGRSRPDERSLGVYTFLPLVLEWTVTTGC